MKEIMNRVWHEPAVFIGLAATVVVVVVTVTTDDTWDAATIVGAAAPLLSALGIRQLVTPVEWGTHDEHGEHEVPKQADPPPGAATT
jgi:hypothetical protein